MTRPTPFVSVIVPTIGRPALAECLASLAAQDYPPDSFEILVVDDGSEPPGVAVPDWGTSAPPVLVFRQPRAGPAAARNLAIGRARGEIVALIDDDCTAEAGWLAALVGALAPLEGAGAGGDVRNALPDNPLAETSQMLVSYVCSYYNADPGAARFFTSNNLAFDRRALVEAGAFNAVYQRAAAEDRELCDRWRCQGRPLVSAAGAVVWHAHHLGVRAFWRQHLTYGRGAWQFRRAKAARDGSRVRIEPARFYLGLLAWPFRRRGVAGLPYAGLLLVAQAANLAGFAQEALRDRARRRTSRRVERTARMPQN